MYMEVILPKRPVPVPEESSDPDSISVPAPARRGKGDPQTNRHAPRFRDRRKVASKRACRGNASSRDEDFLLQGLTKAPKCAIVWHPITLEAR